MKMTYPTYIAIVNKKTNLVDEIIWGLFYDLKKIETDEIIPIVIEELNVQVGDEWYNNEFYHNGTKVINYFEEYAQNMSEIDQQTAELVEIIYEMDKAEETK